MKFPTVIVLSGILLIQASCADKSAKSSEDEKYVKSKESVRQTEINHPEKFLSVEFKRRKNLLGQLVIEGKVLNKSSAVSYKNVELLLSFYGSTNSLLKEEREVIYDSIPPGRFRSFKRKYFNAEMTDSMAVTVVAAGHTD